MQLNQTLNVVPEIPNTGFETHTTMCGLWTVPIELDFDAKVSFVETIGGKIYKMG